MFMYIHIYTTERWQVASKGRPGQPLAVDYIYLCVYICINIYKYICLFTYIYMCICIHICTCTRIFIQQSASKSRTRVVQGSLWLWITHMLCVYVYINIYVYIHTYIYIYMCVYVYTYVYVHTYLYIRALASREQESSRATFCCGLYIDCVCMCIYKYL